MYTLRWGELQEALVMGYQGEGFMKTFGGSGEENGKVSFSCKIEFITFNLQVSLGSQAGKKRKL